MYLLFFKNNETRKVLCDVTRIHTTPEQAIAYGESFLNDKPEQKERDLSTMELSVFLKMCATKLDIGELLYAETKL